MGTILDPILIGELALSITAIMQILKSKKGIPGSVIPFLGGLVGIVCGLLWYAVSGELHSSHVWLGVEWTNIYRGFMVGVVASVASNSAYIVQKNLPGFNLLPSASELRQGAVAEKEEQQAIVVEAVEGGLDPEEAKDAVGLPQDAPPSNEALKEIQPDLPTNTKGV